MIASFLIASFPDLCILSTFSNPKFDGDFAC